jgi:hypothetical protein
VTLTWQHDLLNDQVQYWHPVVSSRAPGFAAAVSMTDRLRLVVLDLTAGDGLGAEVLREVNQPTMALSAADLADQLMVDYCGRSRCSSVAIADLFPDGRLDLQVRNAPPAVLLSAGVPARLLPGRSTSGILDRVAPGEVLLLCSASYLEDPPAVLGTVRQSPGDDTSLDRLRRALETAPHCGATASVAAPPGDF